jgi:hypothetical protein
LREKISSLTDEGEVAELMRIYNLIEDSPVTFKVESILTKSKFKNMYMIYDDI